MTNQSEVTVTENSITTKINEIKLSKNRTSVHYKLKHEKIMFVIQYEY